MKPSNQAMAEEWVAGSVLMESEDRHVTPAHDQQPMILNQCKTTKEWWGHGGYGTTRMTYDQNAAGPKNFSRFLQHDIYLVQEKKSRKKNVPEVH